MGQGEEVSDLVRLVPAGAGLYEARLCPSIDPCLDTLKTKILSPHSGPVPPDQLAPQAQLTSGETGSSFDLETRIDQAPASRHVATMTAQSNSRISCRKVRSMQCFTYSPPNATRLECS